MDKRELSNSEIETVTGGKIIDAASHSDSSDVKKKICSKCGHLFKYHVQDIKKKGHIECPYCKF